MNRVAKINIPARNIVGATLGLTPVAGVTCVPSADGRYIEIRNKMGLDDTRVPNGDPANADPLEAYSIDYYEDGVLVSTYQLPSKQSRTYYRLPLNPNANIKPLYTPQQLHQARLVFRIGVPDLRAKALPPLVYDSPIAFPGMARYWHTTGERYELGVFSEWVSEWLRSGSQEALSSMLAVGEAGGMVPWYYIDKATGKFVDKLANLHANDYGADSHYAGTPWFKRATVSDTEPTHITVAMDHPPEQSYVCGLITHDPFYCRNLQASAIQFVIEGGVIDPATGRVYLNNIEQRSLAWGSRNFGMAWKLTLEFERLGILPDDCLPSSFFDSVLKATRELVLQPYMDDPEYDTARCFWSDAAMAPWQQNYVIESLGFLVLIGRTEYNDAFLWNLGNVVRQCSGISGWPAGLPSAFWVYIGPKGSRLKGWDAIWNEARKPVGTGPGAQLGGQYTQAGVDALQADQYNGGRISRDASSEYSISAHGAISIALDLHALGIVDVFTPYPEIGQAYGNIHRFMYALELSMQNPDGTNSWFRDNNSAGWYPNTRNLYDFDRTKFAANTFTPGAMPSPLSAANNNPPPPPPHPLPPAKEIHMGNPFKIGPGQVITLPITWNADAGAEAKMPTGITVKATPDGIVSLALAADFASVAVTGLPHIADGTQVTVEVDGTGAGPLSDTAIGTEELPLATSIHINP